jgi:hypothetical protein
MKLRRKVGFRKSIINGNDSAKICRLKKTIYTTTLSDTFIIFNFFLGLIVAKKKRNQIQFYIIDSGHGRPLEEG